MIRAGLPVAVVIACLWLLACTHAPPPAAATDAPGLRVVTLNLYHDRGHWERRRPLVIDGLRTLDADVIALQEVLQKAGLRNQAEDIGAALGYAVHFVSTDPPGQDHRYGNALLSRRPVLARSEARLQPLDDSRTVAHLRIDVQGHAVDVFNTHLHWTDDGAAIRARQLDDVLAHVDRHDAGASVLMGDFNAEADAPELQALARAGFVDVPAALEPAANLRTTLNPHYFERGRRIDHVFARGARLRPLATRRVLDAAADDGTWPSDHFGVLAQFRIGH
ncbi:endonuclease/exonuclease/phosphatase family protein [Luteimonas yindakuii]|uniref:endonuclease/exonuclease/phosphatase family protein n=1 Tax=Luteimonas yindakuii TaxID=2565782 RepID=UPI0010A42D54|nr:endonuclease/exonuclease/phosphatase family protein [Luteimonas yindakuii]QCO67507.1 endonuclease/exonuclease/phosphatase family protein [Luteimonas yindakuii]